MIAMCCCARSCVWHRASAYLMRDGAAVHGAVRRMGGDRSQRDPRHVPGAAATVLITCFT
eukprot:3548712-Pyramimonas_sp.AAC.1